jgi:putative membrane protein
MAKNEQEEKPAVADINKRQNVSDHLANERTFLAWIRTGVGIMAFGFVVVKFSLFIKQLSAILGKEVILPQKGYSAVAGIVLVALGSLTTVFSFLRYNQTEKKLASGIYQQSSLLIAVMTILIFAISLFLIYYLVEST